MSTSLRTTDNRLSTAGKSASVLTIAIGMLVAGNFALAKFAVLGGAGAFAVFYWQLVGASVFLLLAMAMQGQRPSLKASHIRYCLIGGLLGVSAPQLVAYTVLKHIPAGLFTVLVTLSPLMTFLLTSLYEKRLLPLYRLTGILIGLAGVSMATIAGFDTGTVSAHWLALAFGVPLLLGITNVYRSKALPPDAHPMSLATGTLLSQVFLLMPVFLLSRQIYLPFFPVRHTDFAIIALAVITALSYILTFILQRRTDGVGFSQVGYFVTLSGVFIGAIAFDEPFSVSLVSAVVLLFVGLVMTNGKLSVRKIVGQLKKINPM